MKARFGISSLFAALAVWAIPSFAAPPPPDSCTGLTGPALGLCRAAVSVGCDGSAGQPAGCATLEGQYREVTGDPQPPWLPPPPCPCGSAADFLELASGIRELSCTHHLIRTEAGDTFMTTLDRADIVPGTPNLVFSFHPGSYALLQKQTCGRFNESLFTVTDAEAETCVAQIVEAATLRLVPCISPLIPGP